MKADDSTEKLRDLCREFISFEDKDIKFTEINEGNIDKFVELMKEIFPNKVFVLTTGDREYIELYCKLVNCVGNILTEDTSLDSSLMTAYDWWYQEDIRQAAKILILFNMPYFKPDEWLGKMSKVNPLVLAANSKLPIEIEKRLFEATYCYVYGFYDASGSLCRSVLEGSLKKALPRKGISLPDRCMLGFMLKKLEESPEEEKRQLGWNTKKITKIGDKLLHNLDNINEPKCYSIIKDTRKLLEELV